MACTGGGGGGKIAIHVILGPHKDYTPQVDPPQRISEGTVQQDFWCHKMHYTINCQILGNDDGLIHNLNADWQGQTMTPASGPPLLARKSPTDSGGFWWRETQHNDQ
jgi:hypothetical protein